MTDMRTLKTVEELAHISVHAAVKDARINLKDVDGLFSTLAMGSIHTMLAHYLASVLGLVPRADTNFIAKTVQCGGGSPLAALLDVAIVNASLWCALTQCGPFQRPNLWQTQPVVDMYNRVAEFHIQRHGLKREHLAMAAVVMSRQAKKHPLAYGYQKELTLEQVMNSRKISSATNLLECTRRANGGGCFIIASDEFVRARGLQARAVSLIGAGESSAPYNVSSDVSKIEDWHFTLRTAVRVAYKEAQITDPVREIGFFGLYDCYPVVLIKAIEDVGLCERGGGGAVIEHYYRNPHVPCPINTHGGLQAFGAPVNTPAIFNVIEAVIQIRGEAQERQLQNVDTALAYACGGVCSHSAVVILRLFSSADAQGKAKAQTRSRL